MKTKGVRSFRVEGGREGGMIGMEHEMTSPYFLNFEKHIIDRLYEMGVDQTFILRLRNNLSRQFKPQIHVL